VIEILVHDITVVGDLVGQQLSELVVCHPVKLTTSPGLDAPAVGSPAARCQRPV
jgi:hypothetical protein